MTTMTTFSNVQEYLQRKREDCDEQNVEEGDVNEHKDEDNDNCTEDKGNSNEETDEYE